MPDINDHIRRIERVGTPELDHDRMMAEFEARGGKVQVIPRGTKAIDFASIKYGEYQSKLAGALRRELV